MRVGPLFWRAMSIADQVPDFSGLRVAVVGDLIADHYVYGRPSRLSREAPVMILRHAGEDVGAGGAANVALNLWALGARTRLLGAVGRDEFGGRLVEVIEGRDLRTGDVLAVEGWTTPTKTRILGAEPRRTLQQMLRIDREPDRPLAAEVRAALCDRLHALLPEIDALVVSDYGYGAVGEELAALAREASGRGVVTVLDPRDCLRRFGGITAATPNLAELARAAGRTVEELEDPQVLGDAAREVVQQSGLAALLVTMGNRGMALFGAELPAGGLAVEASGSDEVIDVSGAGDTAAAAFTLALAAGVPAADAMRMANAAAGVVVMESGTAVCTVSKLRKALPGAPLPGPRG